MMETKLRTFLFDSKAPAAEKSPSAAATEATA